MRVAPADLSEAALTVSLREHWGIESCEVDYLPVGFGGHHWRVSGAQGDRWFVTIDDLSQRMRVDGDTLDSCFAQLASAYLASRELADAGLDFVVAPEPAGDATVTDRIADTYSLVVHRYLADARTTTAERGKGDAERQVVALLARLHATPAPAAPRDTLTVPNRTHLLEDHDWADGPYTQRARRLIALHRGDLSVLVAYYEELAQQIAARPEPLAITHGEPHCDNVLRTACGLALVDWDTALLAPPERDLWMLADDQPGVLETYREVTGLALDPDILSFYRLWFDLDEIGGYTRLFRAPHADDANTTVAWGGLQEHLRPRERWPQAFR